MSQSTTSRRGRRRGGGGRARTGCPPVRRRRAQRGRAGRCGRRAAAPRVRRDRRGGGGDAQRAHRRGEPGELVGRERGEVPAAQPLGGRGERRVRPPRRRRVRRRTRRRPPTPRGPSGARRPCRARRAAPADRPGQRARWDRPRYAGGSTAAEDRVEDPVEHRDLRPGRPPAWPERTSSSSLRGAGAAPSDGAGEPPRRSGPTGSPAASQAGAEPGHERGEVGRAVSQHRSTSGARPGAGAPGVRSSSYFSTAPRVRSAAAASSASTPSASSAERPADRLGHAGRLVQVQAAQPLHRAAATCAASEPAAAGTRRRMISATRSAVRVADPVVEAAALERVVQVAGAVGGEHGDRRRRWRAGCPARGWSPPTRRAARTGTPRTRRRRGRPRR